MCYLGHQGGNFAVAAVHLHKRGNVSKTVGKWEGSHIGAQHMDAPQHNLPAAKQPCNAALHAIAITLTCHHSHLH